MLLILAAAGHCEGWLSTAGARGSAGPFRTSSSSSCSPNTNNNRQRRSPSSLLATTKVVKFNALPPPPSSSSRMRRNSSSSSPLSHKNIDELAVALTSCYSAKNVLMTTTHTTATAFHGDHNNNNISNNNMKTHEGNKIIVQQQESSLDDGVVVSTSVVNGDDVSHPVDGLLLPEAPPLTYQKFLTMQEKRAVVLIRYSSDAALKPYFLTVAKKLKASHPDVIIERRILPKVPDHGSSSSSNEEPTFEIVVDGKVVVGSTGKGGRPRKSKLSRQDMQKGRSIFVSMSELDIAICRARRKSRPSSTVYGDGAGAGTTATAVTKKTK